MKISCNCWNIANNPKGYCQFCSHNKCSECEMCDSQTDNHLKNDHFHIRKSSSVRLFDGLRRSALTREARKFKMNSKIPLELHNIIMIPINEVWEDKFCIDCLIGLRDYIDSLIDKVGDTEEVIIYDNNLMEIEISPIDPFLKTIIEGTNLDYWKAYKREQEKLKKLQGEYNNGIE